MPLSTNNIITPTTPLSSLSFLYNMSMNQLVQNPHQAWIWQPNMEYSYHHYLPLEQQQQGNYGREAMFEKPLTPSDVGKLNRLVIPKQHAEKYFPLDSESGEKGLLLSFEDELAKSWKFRYSYWTSSQSYVLTKGWSRYVKEKRLDAGDVIFFERNNDDDRLFIGCRRRGSSDTTTAAAAAAAPASVQDVTRSNAALPWTPTFYAATGPYPTPYCYMNSVNSGEQASSPGESPSAATATGNSKRLRLFGVNLEFGPDPQEPQHLVSGSWNHQFMTTNASTSQL